MSKEFVSRANIHFIPPEQLIGFVTLVEKIIPGWWWSLSQEPGRVSLNMGPGRNCPNLFDNGLALTDKGDHGYPLHTAYSETFDLERLTTFGDNFERYVEIIRKTYVDGGGEEKPQSRRAYRHQSAQALTDLQGFYSSFLDKLPRIEEFYDYTVTQLYLGSCDTSADCSIRGTRPNGDKFDVTVDFCDEDVTIAESVRWSLRELSNDIYTYRKG